MQFGLSPFRAGYTWHAHLLEMKPSNAKVRALASAAVG